MPFVSLSDRVRLHYEDVGKGDPVIVIHGFMGTARTDLGLVIDWLKNDYRVLGPSLRGYGKSTPNPRVFPLDFYSRDAKDLIAFIKKLKLPKVRILGYSDGGEVALLVAALAPDLIKSVAVWGAVGMYGDKMSQPAKNFAASLPSDPMILQWLRTVNRLINQEGVLAINVADKITCPILMLLGKEDYLNPPEYAQKFLKHVKHGKLVMLNCAHAVHIQAESEFQKIVGEFLR